MQQKVSSPTINVLARQQPERQEPMGRSKKGGPRLTVCRLQIVDEEPIRQHMRSPARILLHAHSFSGYYIHCCS